MTCQNKASTYTAPILAALGLVLAGCASSTGAPRAPVEEGGPPQLPRKTPATQQTLTAPSAGHAEPGVSRPSARSRDTGRDTVSRQSAVLTPPSPGPAVVALLETAERQQAEGQLASAAASLERALRIEPQSAWTWYRLAVVRFTQGRLGQAEQLARRSDALAGNDNEVRARNWRLIALIREHRGDQAGAKAARKRAQALGP